MSEIDALFLLIKIITVIYVIGAVIGIINYLDLF